MTMTAIDLIRAGSIDPFDQNAAILELDERLRRVEAFIGTETEEEFLAFIRSLPKPKMPSANPYSKPESDK
jgi:hypothetical protein